jgi:hypothetical protein
VISSRAFALSRALVARHLGADAALPSEPLATPEWQQLVTVVRGERLEPVLVDGVHAGALPVTEAQQLQADELHVRAMGTAILLDRQLLEVAERFDARAIPFAVLKGAAVAHLDYPDPSARAYGDVDVLVPAAHIDRARTCVAEMGGRRTYREPRPGFDRRFGKGTSFKMATGLEVDVHRTLALGPFGLAIDLDDLFEQRVSFAVGGQQLLALDRPRRFLHACYHAVLGRARPRCVPLLDIARLVPTTGEEAREVVRLSAKWQGSAVVMAAFDEMRKLGWSPPEAMLEVLPRLTSTRRQQRWLSAYRGDHRSSARLSMFGLEAVTGWRDRIVYVSAVAWPAERSAGDRARRLVRGLSSAVGKSR